MYNIGNNDYSKYNNYFTSEGVTSNTAPSGDINLSKIQDSILNSMLEGDLFNATISDVNNDHVSLTLNGGKTLTAILDSSVNNMTLTKGQNITFMINKNSDSIISIKPVETNLQADITISKALDAANLVYTKRNGDMVREMMNYNMSIDKQSLNQMIKELNIYPDEDISNLIRMVKLNIPLTDDNIAQFKAYTSYEQNISGQLDIMSNQISDFIAQLADTLEFGDNTSLAAVNNTINNLIESLYSEINESEIRDVLADALPDDERIKLSNELQSLVQDNDSEILHALNQYSDTVAKGDINVKDALTQLADIIKDMKSTDSTDLEMLHNLLNSKTMENLIKSAVRDTLNLKPSDITKDDAIKEFYARALKTMDNIDDAVKDGKTESLSKSINTVRSNINFMNTINNDFTYVQLPVKFQQSEANGELYVYTNKKSMIEHPDDISALLHLDMENLGPVDIYVKLKEKHVSTNFCLESEEMLDFVYEHIDMLNKRLEKLGYNMTFEMHVNDNDSDNMELSNKKNPIDVLGGANVSSHYISQYTFDYKA